MRRQELLNGGVIYQGNSLMKWRELIVPLYFEESLITIIVKSHNERQAERLALIILFMPI
jgi:hypothetical protein